jgi:Bacterial Ig domain
MTAPGNGSVVSGAAVSLAATASDNVGVAGVQFRVDGTNQGSEDTTSPYGVTWNTTSLPNGTHTITAVARDAAGNRTTSASVVVTVSNATAGQALLGDQVLETGNDSVGAGQAEAFRTTATASGSVATMRVYVGTGTKLAIGIYAANGTHPGALLGQATLTGLTANAWNAVTLPATSVTSGSTYWIALLSPSGSGTLTFRDKPGGGASETSSQATLASLPATWTTGSTYTDGPLSAYGTG